MTALTAPYASTPATPARATSFERTLLRTAAALDTFVASRLDRRGGESGLRATAVEAASTRTRTEAQALGALGMIPR